MQLKGVLSNQTFTFVLANFLEQLVYYGLRSFFIIFVIDLSTKGILNLSEQQAQNAYTQFLFYLGFAYLIAGPIIDALKKPRRAMYTGITLLIASCALLMYSPGGLEYALVLALAGMAMFRPASMAQISLCIGRQENRLNTAFSLQYFAIMLAALFSPILFGLLYETYGYQASFLVAACLLAVILPLIRRMWDTSQFTSWQYHKISCRTCVLVVITTLFFYSIYWGFYEVSGNYTLDADPKGTLNMVNPIAILLLLPLVVLVQYKDKLSNLAGVLLGLGIFAITLLVLVLHVKGALGLDNLQAVAVLSVLWAASEALLMPSMYTTLAKYTPARYFSTVFGVALFATTVMVNFVLNNMTGLDDNYLLGISAIFAVVGFVSLVITRHKLTNVDVNAKV